MAYEGFVLRWAWLMRVWLRKGRVVDGGLGIHVSHGSEMLGLLGRVV